MLGNSVRSGRGVFVPVGFVFFVAAFIGLVYHQVNWWEIPLRPNSKHPVDPVPAIVNHPAVSQSTAPPIVQDTDVSQIMTPPAGSASDGDALEDHDRLRDFYLEQLYKPAVAPDSPTFKPRDAFEWKLPEQPHWKEPMGEKLCIINFDDREFAEAGDIFGPDLMHWGHPNGVHGLSLGLLNHYIYARIHGYKYYYVNVVPPADRRATWRKPAIISKILKEHDVCVFMDSDVLFRHLDLPFEWLMNYWTLYPENHAMALAIDPDRPYNKDRLGKTYLNTGFIVSQNKDVTYEILDDWNKCPDKDGPYPECEEFANWRLSNLTDQGGFGTFVRYKFPEHIRELPCNEANGYPQSRENCAGTFVLHEWTGKWGQLKLDAGEKMPGPFLKLFHEEFLREKPKFYMEEADLYALGPSGALEGKPPA